MKKILWLVAGVLLVACGNTNGPNSLATVEALSTQVATVEMIPTVTPVTVAPRVTETPLQIVTSTPPVGAISTDTPAPQNLLRPNGNLVLASRRLSAISLDGGLTDWLSLPAYAIDQVVYRPASRVDAADHSGSFNIVWDESYLWLAVQIVDDVHVQTQHGETIFRGDSLEVLLDADLSGDFTSTDLSADDYQLGMSPGALKGDGSESYLWFPRSRAGNAATVTTAAKPDGQGYILEVAIPWSVLGVTNPQAGQRFGFALSASDNDTNTTALQESMISNIATRKLTDPTTWGTLELGK